MTLAILKALSNVLRRVEDVLITLALGGAALLIAVQVVSRYVFNYTPSWSEELARYLIVWTIFIGVAVGVRKNIHIGVDAFIRLARPRVRVAMQVALNLIGAVVSIALIWLAALFIADTVEYEQLSPAMQLPMWLPYLAMPVGLGFAVVHFVQRVVELLVSERQPKAGSVDAEARVRGEAASRPARARRSAG